MRDKPGPVIPTLLWGLGFIATLCVPGLVIRVIGPGTWNGVMAGVLFSGCLALMLWWGNKPEKE